MNLIVEQIADHVLQLYGARALMQAHAPEEIAEIARVLVEDQELGAVMVAVEASVRDHLGRPAGAKDEHISIFFTRVARRLIRGASRAA
ncbi:MAG: hypothetical protein IT384_27010 [Deltaproteobacteria bacterium]|nr:hypothetical protein [Deltaproteobacteria bacterium]